MGTYSATRDLRLGLHKRWYIFSNRVEAVIFKEVGKDQPFVFVQRLKNPRGHLTNAEIGSDRPGKGVSSGGMGSIHHAFERINTQHERTAKLFAERIAESLGRAKRQGRFTELVVAAEPHFLGVLRHALPPSVRKAIRHEINREYLQLSDKDLYDQVQRTLGA